MTPGALALATIIFLIKFPPSQKWEGGYVDLFVRYHIVHEIFPILILKRQNRLVLVKSLLFEQPDPGIIEYAC